MKGNSVLTATSVKRAKTPGGVGITLPSVLPSLRHGLQTLRGEVGGPMWGPNFGQTPQLQSLHHRSIRKIPVFRRCKVQKGVVRLVEKRGSGNRKKPRGQSHHSFLSEDFEGHSPRMPSACIFASTECENSCLKGKKEVNCFNLSRANLESEKSSLQ